MNTLERNIEILDDALVSVLKQKTPQERLKIAFSMWNCAKKQLTCHLKSLHPEWSDEKVQNEVKKRLSHGSV